MKHASMMQSLALALLLTGVAGLAACAPGQSLAGMNTAVPTIAATAVPAATAAAGQGQPPDAVPATVPTEDLIAQVRASVPQGAFTGFRALPLTVAKGAQPLWAVISTGQINFDLQPVTSHFLAIYTLAGNKWQELARLSLDVEKGGPTYVGEKVCRQVDIEPSHVWFVVNGGMGAHGGAFELISFDGKMLQVDVNLQSASPGMGSVRDVNGDGQPDVVLDESDPYVFCYACGARKVQFQVQRWDGAQGKLAVVDLQRLPASLPEAVTKPANRAVELAQGGLWKDAYASIEEAMDAAKGVPGDTTTLKWDEALIKLHADALKETLTIEYPLIQQVFYGDYAAAVDVMRQYKPAEIFAADSPLVSDPGVQPFIESLSQHLIESATQALRAEPDLAAAYFIRGWGEYLADPASAQARADVGQAAKLAPDDALYAGSVAALK